ncbi:MAG TPA: hypothetical protein VM818_11410, partial [Vicinamibacterales bacterium]|nr:hypothetical protein [Vicinamibacterales bacterium]
QAMAEILTPSRLWKRMSGAQRLASSRAFWSDTEAVDEQVQAAMLIAQQKKFRPKTVIGLDLDRKSKHLASLATLPDPIAGRVLVLYHLTDQRALMSRFLDALGIEHENGLIKADDVKPDSTKLAPAAAALAQEFPADDVRLYLTTLMCQDPDTWGGLSDIVKGLEGQG